MPFSNLNTDQVLSIENWYYSEEKVPDTTIILKHISHYMEDHWFFRLQMYAESHFYKYEQLPKLTINEIRRINSEYQS